MLSAEFTKDPRARWHMDRYFLRPVKGTYTELFKQTLAGDRVFSTGDMPFGGGPVAFTKFGVSPTVTDSTQAIETHIEVLAPGGCSQKHGHVNGAVMYILEGHGYDLHDGKRIDWKAGDILIVESCCVHEHYNLSSEEPVRILVMKAKPLFMLFRLFFQRMVRYAPKEPVPGFEGWHPDTHEKNE